MLLTVVVSYPSCASKGIRGFYPPKLSIKDARFDGDALVLIAENFVKIQICVEDKCEVIPEGSIIDSEIVVKFEPGVENAKVIFWGFGEDKEEIYVNPKEKKIRILEN